MDYFFVKSNRKFKKISIGDIEFIEASKNYSIIHTLKGKTLVLINLKRVEDFLEGQPFVRVHKSFIVSIHKIQEFDMDFINLNQTQIPIGQLYRNSFIEKVTILKADAADNGFTTELNGNGIEYHDFVLK